MSKIIKDEVFGELQFGNYNWKKEEKFSFWGLSRTLEICINSRKDESFTKEQKNSYSDFKNNLEKHTDLFLKKIDHYVCNYLDDYELNILFETANDYLSLKGQDLYLNKENLKKHFLELLYNKDLFFVDELIDPRTLQFEPDGDYGLLCECEWDPEHGLAIYYQNSELKIGLQNEFL